MVLVEIRRGRPLDLRLELGRRIVDICVEVLGVANTTLALSVYAAEVSFGSADTVRVRLAL
jgi:hypothetical protein